MPATTLASLSPRRRQEPPAAVCLPLQLEHVPNRADGIIRQTVVGYRDECLVRPFRWGGFHYDAGRKSKRFLYGEKLEGSPQRRYGPRRLGRLEEGVELADGDLARGTVDLRKLIPKRHGLR